MHKGVWVHLHVALPFLQRGTTSVTSHDIKALPKWGSTLKGKNLLSGSKFFLERVDSHLGQTHSFNS